MRLIVVIMAAHATPDLLPRFNRQTLRQFAHDTVEALINDGGGGLRLVQGRRQLFWAWRLLFDGLAEIASRFADLFESPT